MPSPKTVLRAAPLVGTLDISAAFVQYFFRTGKEPFRPVLTFVARGLLGKHTTVDKEVLPVVGLLVHYCLAAAFTALFFLAVARLSFTRKHPLLSGILYGLLCGQP